MAVSPGQHLAVGSIGVHVQVEVVTRVVDHGRLEAGRVAEFGFLEVLHGGFVGTVHQATAEEGVELTDHDLHRSFDLGRDWTEEHRGAGVELATRRGLLEALVKRDYFGICVRQVIEGDDTLR